MDCGKPWRPFPRFVNHALFARETSAARPKMHSFYSQGLSMTRELDRGHGKSWPWQRVLQISGRCKGRSVFAADFEGNGCWLAQSQPEALARDGVFKASEARRAGLRGRVHPLDIAQYRGSATIDGASFTRSAAAGSQHVYRAVVPSRSTTAPIRDRCRVVPESCKACGNAVKPGVCGAFGKSRQCRHTNCHGVEERDSLWHGGWLLAPLTVPLGLRPAVVFG